MIYLVTKGQHKSFAPGLTVHRVNSRGQRLLQLVQVKHFIQAVVIIGDHITNNMAIIFIGIDLMVHTHRTRVEFGPDHLLCLSIDEMNQRLGEKGQNYRNVLSRQVRRCAEWQK